MCYSFQARPHAVFLVCTSWYVIWWHDKHVILCTYAKHYVVMCSVVSACVRTYSMSTENRMFSASLLENCLLSVLYYFPTDLKGGLSWQKFFVFLVKLMFGTLYIFFIIFS